MLQIQTTLAVCDGSGTFYSEASLTVSWAATAHRWPLISAQQPPPPPFSPTSRHVRRVYFAQHKQLNSSRGSLI